MQLPHPVLIHLAIHIQNAEDDTVCAELFCDEDVTLHDAEFVGAVMEISAARTDHYLYADRNFFAHRGNHACAGRGAAFRKSGAEFNPVRTASLGGHGGLHRVKTYLQQDLAGTDLRLGYHTRQRFSRTMGCPALQLKACWNSGMFTTRPFTRYLPGECSLVMAFTRRFSGRWFSQAH